MSMTVLCHTTATHTVSVNSDATLTTDWSKNANMVDKAAG